MNKEQMRIAIAEACGVTIRDKHDWEERDDRRYFVCRRCDEVVNWGEYSNKIGETNARCSGTDRDYPNDLNAMHEAITSTFKDSIQKLAFHRALSEVVSKGSPNFPGYDVWDAENATAEQRAESFLKVIDRWVET